MTGTVARSRRKTYVDTGRAPTPRPAGAAPLPGPRRPSLPFDVPEDQARGLQEAGQVLAVGDGRQVLAEQDVGDGLVEARLVPLHQLVALGADGGDELQSHP